MKNNKKPYRWFVAGLLSFSFVLAGTACSKRGEKPVPVVPPRSDVQKPAPMPGPDSPKPATQTTDSEVAGNALAGTTWAIGDVTVTFRDESSFFAKGDVVAQFAPDGIEGAYTLEGNIVELSGLGQTMTGTFDGATLVIDGKTAVRQE